MSTSAASDARAQLGRLAKYAYSTTNGTQRPLDHLETVEHMQWMLDAARDLFVQAARDDGANWGQIGRAVGITRQGARERWGVTTDGDAADPGW